MVARLMAITSAGWPRKCSMAFCCGLVIRNQRYYRCNLQVEDNHRCEILNYQKFHYRDLDRKNKLYKLRSQKPNLCLKDLHLCFADYSEAFDSIIQS
ncbi:hypothetical protein PoB_007002100 [Plakobranchus ocellatus]|uniref:Uncharacterized protein n=1 Tax=Plakobranchus ocellatus TaxID=259542 RepID=A0AAV4DI30_9GAST|nr:hypothetical protein PoB_007002100 [Plakobranchus ocellatus]